MFFQSEYSPMYQKICTLCHRRMQSLVSHFRSFLLSASLWLSPPFEKREKEQLKQLIKESRLAVRWGKSRRTIQRWRVAGRMPPHVQVGSTIFYFVEDVIAHEEALLSGREEV